jgi:hypothetical protein
MSTPPPRFLADWTKLWQLARRVAGGTDNDPDDVFMPVGLRLEDPSRPDRGDYESTPTNATTFASTGGDGVHFSVLNVNERDDACPVVMTVPMAFDNPNTVVGADLREFLGLGYRTGYFYLEGLAYRWGRDETIAAAEAGTPPANDEEGVLLQYLNEEFDLRPWAHVRERLGELDATYRPGLHVRLGT